MGKIKETAAGGSTGAGSIAVVPSNRLGGMQSRMSLKDFMMDFYGRINNRNKFKPVPNNLKGSISKITETAAHPYQLDDATSRLKNMQAQGEYEKTDIITYGIQDDTGNLMLVTVPLQQSETFERHVAQALADVLDFKKTGRGEDKSLAELLYELKDEFTIINAEFPTIPKDAVYNADEITTDLPEADENTGDDEDEEFDPETDDEEETEGENEFDPDDEEVGDEFDEEQDKESLLTSVLSMLKSQAEKEVAQANAEAEQAKARQAELALKASRNELESQEEMVAAQAEMEAEKEKEKRAKEMAELAKYKYKQKKGTNEGFSPLFRSTLLELDPNDTPQTLRRQLASIPIKYKVEPEDSPETQRFKRQQQQLATREIRLQMRAAQNRQDHEEEMRDREQEQPKDQEQNNDLQARRQQQTRTNDRGTPQ